MLFIEANIIEEVINMAHKRSKVRRINQIITALREEHITLPEAKRQLVSMLSEAGKMLLDHCKTKEEIIDLALMAK